MVTRVKPRVAIIHSASSKNTASGEELAIYLGVCLQLGGDWRDVNVVQNERFSLGGSVRIHEIECKCIGVHYACVIPPATSWSMAVLTAVLVGSNRRVRRTNMHNRPATATAAVAVAVAVAVYIVKADAAVYFLCTRNRISQASSATSAHPRTPSVRVHKSSIIQIPTYSVAVHGGTRYQYRVLVLLKGMHHESDAHPVPAR